MRRARAGLWNLRQGNAHSLPFETGSFDTVVCTFGLCAIPDLDAAVDEMVRVLRPGATLILLDHVRSSSRVAPGVQRSLELISVPLGGEHFLRRPLEDAEARGLVTERVERVGMEMYRRSADGDRDFHAL